MKMKMKMKIKPEHYAEIIKAAKVVKANNPKMTPQYYVENKLGKDHAKRFRWDVFYACKFEGEPTSSHWCCRVIYPYANDEHIDTALKHVVKEVWG